MEALQGRISKYNHHASLHQRTCKAVLILSNHRFTGATIRVLSAMKGIRMTGLTDVSYRKLQLLRMNELRHANGFRMVMVFSFCIGKTALLRKDLEGSNQ